MIKEVGKEFIKRLLWVSVDPELIKAFGGCTWENKTRVLTTPKYIEDMFQEAILDWQKQVQKISVTYWLDLLKSQSIHQQSHNVLQFSMISDPIQILKERCIISCPEWWSKISVSLVLHWKPADYDHLDRDRRIQSCHESMIEGYLSDLLHLASL